MSEQADGNSAKLRIIFSRVFGIPVESLPATIDADSIATWDSLAHLSLIEHLERDFGIHLSQAEAVTMLSEADIVRLLAKKARE